LLDAGVIFRTSACDDQAAFLGDFVDTARIRPIRRRECARGPLSDARGLSSCDHRARMTRCCPHNEDEHAHVTVCTEQIHYPSEDYPCLCDGIGGDEALCETCGHKRGSHIVERVCRPTTGESCNCASSH
jgi:hypothetical protein